MTTQEEIQELEREEHFREYYGEDYDV